MRKFFLPLKTVSAKNVSSKKSPRDYNYDHGVVMRLSALFTTLFVFSLIIYGGMTVKNSQWFVQNLNHISKSIQPLFPNQHRFEDTAFAEDQTLPQFKNNNPLAADTTDFNGMGNKPDLLNKGSNNSGSGSDMMGSFDNFDSSYSNDDTPAPALPSMDSSNPPPIPPFFDTPEDQERTDFNHSGNEEDFQDVFKNSPWNNDNSEP